MFLLIKVHANWCPHCINMRPEWKKLKSSLKFKQIKPRVFDIEEQQLHKLELLNKKYQLQEPVSYKGFPTIVKVHNGNVEYFEGSRDAKNILSWLYTNVNSSEKSKTIKKSKKNKKRKNRTNKRKN